MQTFMADVRYAVRSLARTPSFALAPAYRASRLDPAPVLRD
jgi:hypothetical protein